MIRLTSAAFLLLFIGTSSHAAASPSFADFDKRAKAGETLTVVFFGSWLSWGSNATDPHLTSYRARIAEYMRKEYPKARFTFRDAAVGGSGAQLAAFRLDRDVLKHKPDLVFVDFSANDDLAKNDGETIAAFEALLFRIIQECKAPAVVAIFPFQYHAAAKVETLKRRNAHLKIAQAYNTPVGDAVMLVKERLKTKKVKLASLWPFDRVHPGDAGYALFAKAVWNGFQDAVKKKTVCVAPKKMLFADTYLKTTRFRLATLKQLPAGWRKGKPLRASASFDLLMSRWLDDVVIAANHTTVVDKQGKATTVKQTVNNLSVRFRGTTVLLFGESTAKSCKYRIYLDGKLLTRQSGKEVHKEYDASWLAYLMRGNAHLVHTVATGLDPKTTHTLTIEPVFSSRMIEQELRLESVCVAGGEAQIIAK